MTPDWSAQAEPVPYAKLDNPQSLNLYAYGLNNPVTNADKDGHCIEDACVGEAIWATIAVTSAYLVTPSGQQALHDAGALVQKASSSLSHLTTAARGAVLAGTADLLRGKSLPLEGGVPNSTGIKTDPATGKTTGYVTYDEKGNAKIRVDVTGRPHAGVPTPHAQEYETHANPKDPSKQRVQPKGQVRPARPDEVPNQ